MLTKIKFLLFCFLFLYLTFNGFSKETQDNKDNKQKTEKNYYWVYKEITVTATMSPKAIKDCSASINIISEDDIKIISSSNALNLLNHLPGIFIMRTGDFGRADVHIRGLGQRGRRISVMVDGRPEKMGLFGCTVSHAFPLDNVERIEVVKGPSSVLYGSEALGGVINILTYKPREKSETNFSASYGSFNTQQFNLRHGGNSKKLNYYFTFDRRKSDGHIKNSSYSGYALTGKLNFNLNKSLIASIRGKYFIGKKYEAGSQDHPLSDFWNDYKRGAIDLSLNGKGKKYEFFVKLYRNFGEHKFSDSWHSRDYINGGVLKYTTRNIKNIELTIGADFRTLGGKSFNSPTGSWDKKEGAIFFLNEYIIGSRLILSTGLRLHSDSLYGTETAPHVGIVFQANNNLSLRGTINKGFRSPQLNELYMFPPSNPDLKPETVWNYEIGFKQRISHIFTINGSIFKMKGSNLIETVSNQSPPPKFIFTNSGKFTFNGAEIAFRADLNHNFSTSLSYTYLDTGDQSKGRPGHKLDFSIRFKKKPLYAAIHGQYVTDYYADNFLKNRLPSYFLLNTRINISVLKNLELFIDLNNILDTDYLIFVELPGITTGSYSMPGRNINLGFRFKI